MKAFAGESQANRRYLAFAAKAEKEGKANIARFFRAIAEAETIHALKHLEVAGGVASTKDNLAQAIEGEKHEYTEMYPEFIAVAKEEDQKQALRSLEYANEAEKVHGRIFAQLKARVDANEDASDEAIILCKVCGWVGQGAMPERCPICNSTSQVMVKF